MKLSITEEFLWDIYSLLQDMDDVLDFALTPGSAKWNRLSSIQNPIFAKYRHDENKKAFTNLIYYAKRKGFIRVKNLEGKTAIILTKEGLGKALKASFIMEGKKKRKDGKWAMLIFDVPEKHRQSRDLLRSVLHNLGYKILQQSVWVTPYDVSETTEKLLRMYSLDKYVKIFLIEEIK